MINRMKREVLQLATDPPVGIAAWPRAQDNLHNLEAQIRGPDDSPYEGGVFELDITIPERYPFEPPAIQFKTKIYHPNIDTQGRICLDSLKMPPAGNWQPSLNVNQLLSQIRILMSEPNPDDPLMPDINQVFVMNPVSFRRTAQSWTKKYAMQVDSRRDKKQSQNTEKESLRSKKRKESPTTSNNHHRDVPESNPSKVSSCSSSSESDSDSDCSATDSESELARPAFKMTRVK